MTVDVYKFPPMEMAAYEHSQDDPMSISYGISGTPRGSQTRANRKIVRFATPSIGQDTDALGYIEALKHILSGKMNLIQVTLNPMQHWKRWQDAQVLPDSGLEWTGPGEVIGWTDGGDGLSWLETYSIAATSTSDGWPFLICTGMRPGDEVRPGMAVQQGNDVAYVTRRGVVAADGGLNLYVSKPLATGQITIGARETRVFLVQDLPIVTQTFGAAAYEFFGIEVFEAEFEGGFKVHDPWN